MSTHRAKPGFSALAQSQPFCYDIKINNPLPARTVPAYTPHMTDPSTLPYRPNVGAVLFDRTGRVLVARRADLPNAEGAPGGWQLPQGGIDETEDPRTAVLRELAEEIGTGAAHVIGEHPDWFTYDLPAELLGVALGGQYRGQRQRWFALRFTGHDSDIRLDLDPDPEVDAWQWVPLESLPALAVPFKHAIYVALARDFARYATPVEE